MQIDELVRRAHPARAACLPGTWDERWARQQQAITHDRLRRRRHRTLVGVALTAALAVAISAALIPRWSDSQPSAAAAVLDSAATSVAAQPSAVPAPGQYIYTVTRSLYQATAYGPTGGAGGAWSVVASATYTETDQLWADSSGTGREVVTHGPLQFSSPADQAAWAALPKPSWTTTMLRPVSITGSLTPSLDVSMLPTDPQVLATRIAAGQTGTWVDKVSTGPNSTFQRAALLLAGPDRGMTPALESALYQVLAMRPGATVSTGVTGSSGVKGTAVTIGVASQDTIERIIIDPQTGAPLEVDSPPHSSVWPWPKPTCSVPSACRAGALGAVGPLWSAPSQPVIVGSDTSTAPVGG